MTLTLLIRCIRTVFVAAVVGFLAACGSADGDAAATEADLQSRADSLAKAVLMADGHIDLPYRLTRFMEDVSVRSDRGDFDYVRAKEGGMDVPFMSIYVSASFQQNGGARDQAEMLIDLVDSIAAAHPDKFAVSRTVAEARRHFAEGRVSLPMGMENGAPIEDLDALAHFYDRGIRYVTLTHSRDNHICDSSYDSTRTWNGLSDFGKRLIPAMNDIGMIIDVSHISDSTFYQVMALSEAPVLATHSSCREFTPEFERNMSDDMIRALAANGGVICINFGSAFLRNEYQGLWEKAREELRAYREEHGIPEGSREAMDHYHRYREENARGRVTDVADHIDHVVALVGVDHVGLGSDFDGVMALPADLQDVSQMPNLIAELLRRGYSDDDIVKICGENMMRVWSEVERVAAGG